MQTSASFLAYVHGGLRKGACCMICQKSLLPQMKLGKCGIFCILIQGVMLVYKNYNVIAFKFCIEKFTVCLPSSLVMFDPKYDSGTTYVLKKELPCLTQHSGTSNRTFKIIYEPEDWQFFNFIYEFVSYTGISCARRYRINFISPNKYSKSLS